MYAEGARVSVSDSPEHGRRLVFYERSWSPGNVRVGRALSRVSRLAVLELRVTIILRGKIVVAFDKRGLAGLEQ